MELKQRKNIKNLPKFDTGFNTYGMVLPTWIASQGNTLQNNQQSIVNQATKTMTNIGLGPKQGSVQSGPKNSSGGSSNANITGIAMGALNFTGAMMNSWGPVKSQNELLADAGTSNQSVMGVGYSAQNQVDQDKELKQLSAENTSNTLGAIGSGAALGGSIGSLFPGAGTAIGAGIGAVVGGIASIFGGKSRKRRLMKRIQNARDLASRTNNYKQASAMSTGLQQNYYLNNDYTQDDVLYG